MKGRMDPGRAGVIVLLFMAACGASGGTKQAADGTVNSRSPSASRTMKPTRTPVTPTVPTAINTIVAIPSSTEGPPPDLELVNASIRYDGKGLGYLFGGIRNNTDTTMVFRGPARDGNKNPLFRFKLESWDWYDDSSLGYFTNYEFEVGRGSTSVPNTNCFLYPGETGVLDIQVYACHPDEENCFFENTIIDEPPVATGMRLIGYESLKNYVPWPDLYSGYHPKAENVEFSVKNYMIRFGFDLPKSFFDDLGWYRYAAWIIVYGKNGETLDILHRENISDIITEKDNNTYQIKGFYATGSTTEKGGPGYFLGNLPDKYWDQIGRIEVFVEKQHDFLCSYYANFDSYREKISEENG
jgi:hypothetical protein